MGNDARKENQKEEYVRSERTACEHITNRQRMNHEQLLSLMATTKQQIKEWLVKKAEDGSREHGNRNETGGVRRDRSTQNANNHESEPSSITPVRLTSKEKSLRLTSISTCHQVLVIGSTAALHCQC